jgi:hypothetical protein
MKPARSAEFTHAAPIDRGHGRTPQTQLLIDERNHFLREAARRFCVGMSDRSAAKYLRDALSRYREGRFRRSRFELTCPAAHRGRLDEMCWLLLKIADRVPSIATIRRVLGASREPRSVIRSIHRDDGGEP